MVTPPRRDSKPPDATSPLRVLAHLADAVIVADEVGCIVYVNPAAEALLGWSQDELAQQSLMCLMPERMRDAHQAGLTRYTRTGEARAMGKAMRVTALRRDGSEIDVELKLSAFLPDGSTRLFLASMRDLRERIELERQMNAKRRLLAQHAVTGALIASDTEEEAAPRLVKALCQSLQWDVGFFWGVDEDVQRLRAVATWSHPNLEAEAFVRYSLDVTFGPGEGLPGLVWQTKEPLWSQDIRTDRRYVRRAQARMYGFKEAIIFPILYKNHVLAVIEFVNRVRSEPDDELTQTLAAACFQIGSFYERLRVERDVREQENATRFLATAGALLTKSFDYLDALKQIVQQVTPGFADVCLIYLRSSPSDNLRLSLLAPSDALSAPEAQPADGPKLAHAETLMHVASTVSATQQDVAIEPHQSPIVPTELKSDVKQICDDNALTSFIAVPISGRGRVMGTVCLLRRGRERRQTARLAGFAHDLAERIAYAIDNARLYDEAKHAIAVRDNFLSIASHELKTPLTPLQLQVQSLQRFSSTLPERMTQKLAIILHQVRRLDTLVARLLDISRITNNRMDLKAERMDLAELVRSIAERFAPEMSHSATPIHLRTPPSLVGMWDSVRLEQVICNLISNAAKFGRGKPINLVLSQQDGVACLSVSDQGIGIAEENQARIFERYERAVSVRQFGGFGLGLWISRQLVEASGGTISVQSRPDEGSTFTVNLPITNPPS